MLIPQRYDEDGKAAAVVFATRNVTSVKEIEELIISMKKEMIRQSDDIIQLSVAFGSCTTNDRTFSMKDIYEQADHAMYEDKMKSRSL